LKKFLPHIFVLLVLAAAALLVFAPREERKRVLDERLSLRSRDKIPYGTYVAFEGLTNLFPHASISTNRKEPGLWDSLSKLESSQALIIITPQMLADEYEMRSLIDFVSMGNDVFISSGYISPEALKLLKCSINYLNLFGIFSPHQFKSDTLSVSLSNPPFTRSYTYTFPGKRFATFFNDIDTSIATALGTGELGAANFIHLRAGTGNMYLHLAPIAFTNYFLLKNRNYEYFEDVMSLIPSDKKRIVWDEYYLLKRTADRQDEKKGWLKAFLQHESLKWALITALLTLLLYTLIEMRRKQRPIPVITKPRNDSMDFVRTIGRLYYDKGDHRNLTKKMSAYFLEHIRNRYKIPTTYLNEDFVETLHFKTGVPVQEIRNIVEFIQAMENADKITDRQLAYFHKQLESFYSKT